jgi:hypothetical protein
MVGMNIWDQKNGPVHFGAEELRATLEEYVANTEALLNRLQFCAETNAEASSSWRPHLWQMHAALSRFRDRCRDELGKISLWREDGLDPEEVHELVWQQGEQVVRWLNRMIGMDADH